jgi:hypothetical protein
MKLLLLVLLAAPLRAQFGDAPEEVEGSAQAPADQEAVLEQTTERLKDPGVAASLAARINRSRIADRISGNTDPDAREREILAWIQKDPRSAAGMAIGLANDDAAGTHEFENAVAQRVHRQLEFNPNSKKGILGRLNENAKQSGLMKKQAEDMADEEKREHLKNMFEGEGSQSGKILTEQLEGKGGGSSGPGAVGATGGLSNGYYNRLSQGNLRGYSPQLQSMQSALNLRRPPGAPKLIESGKLDYETLSYPAYGMKFDLDNLEKRLRYEQNWTLARLLGMEGKFKPEELLDPSLEAKLEAQAAGKALPPAFAARLAALDKARAALADFTSTAAAAKDPNQISRNLLIALGGKQKEAARWITVASLEEEVQRLEPQENFLTADLVQTINSCPIDDATRTQYLRRAEELQGSVRALKARDQAALAALQADDWLSKVDSVEASLSAAASLRKDLSRNVEDLRSTAYRFLQSADARPSWRRTLDDYAERFLPSSGYARRLRLERRGRDTLRDAYTKIAQGNADAAHTVLASYEPPSGSKP